jgi:YD repeat-containing protein
VGDETLPAYSFSYNDNSGDLDNFRLLASADNGYGGKVSYGYERFNTPDYNPTDGASRGPIGLTHRVKEKRADDGFGNFYKVAYGYERPLGVSETSDHSGFESFGHQKVSETVFAKNSEGAVVKTTAYQFRQGRVEGSKFYPSPGKGKIERVEVKDSGGKVLSYSENDYLTEALDWPGKNNGRPYDPNDPGLVWKSSHFVALGEARSCLDPTSSWPKGNKTTYHYEPRWQGGQQFGNLTSTTEYLVSDCRFGEATAYRATMQSFYPHLEKNILRLPATAQTFACHSGPSSSGAIADCPQPKRLSNSWNIYDGDQTKAPWSPPEKGLLTLARTLYEFPERVDPDSFSEWRDGRWRVVDVKNDYDRFGNLTATETFTDYGVLSTAGLSWSFSPAGNGSPSHRSEIRFETTYNTFPVETVNALGQRSATSYQYQGNKTDHPYLSNRIVTQDQNDINNQLYKMTVLDGLGRPVENYLPGDNQPSEKISYSDKAPYTVYRRSRDDKDDGTTLAYHHSWQIYDGIGNLLQTQTELAGDGQRISLTAKSYNALGQIEKEILPYEPGAAGGSFINPDWNRPRNEYTYDALGRTLTVTAPPGQSGPRITQTAYFGRKTAVLDPNRHLQVSEIDGLGRLLASQTFLGERDLGIPSDPYTTTRFEYDALDRLTVTTDTLSNTAKVFYNQYGQKERTEDLDLGTWTYTYWPTGTLATTTDAKGQLKSFAYDDLDRTVHKYFGDTNTTPVASFVYDRCQNGVGRRCGDSTINSPEQGFVGATSTYAYDVKGRLQSQTKTIEGQAYTTAFVYDAASRMREITYPDGEKVRYGYNDAGQLVSVSGNQTYLTSARYNALGLPEEEVLGNQNTNVYVYEPNTFRLSSISVRYQGQTHPGASLWTQTLSYDPAGNIGRIGYSGSQAVERVLKFSYEALNRLTGMQTEGRSSEPLAGEYRYDELGRMELKREDVLAAQVGCQPPTIPGDANCNCRVDIFDLVLVGVNYGEAPPDDARADLNGDGKVNIFDLVLVGKNYGNVCGT